MNRYLLSGTNIVSVGYNEITEVLEVEFKLEVIHHYFNVPLNEFVALMKAAQPEEHFLKNVYSTYQFDSIW